MKTQNRLNSPASVYCSSSITSEYKRKTHLDINVPPGFSWLSRLSYLMWKSHIKYGWHQPLDWTKRRKQAGHQLSSLSLPFLTLGTIWPATTSSYYHDIPNMTDCCTLKLWAKIKPFFLIVFSSSWSQGQDTGQIQLSYSFIHFKMCSYCVP